MIAVVSNVILDSRPNDSGGIGWGYWLVPFPWSIFGYLCPALG